MEIIIGVVIVWVVVSCIIGGKNEEVDMNPFIRQLKIIKEAHPILMIIGIVVIIVGLSSCGGTNKDETGNSELNKESELEKTSEDTNVNNGNSITIEEMNTLPIYSLEYLNAYLEINDIEIPKAEKKEEMKKALTNDGEMISLKSYERFWGKGTEYAATKEQTELLYVGEMKNNKPHGWGRIVMLVSAEEYEDEQGIKIEFGECYYTGDNSDIYAVLVYVGEFKDGSYDGYGWEYITPFTNSDDLVNSGYSRNLGEDYIQVGNDVAQNILNTCNPVGYMGEFKKGEYHGEGAKIGYAIREIPINMNVAEQEELFGRRLDREIVIYVGEYKSGKRDGENKEYMFGKLYYSGEIKDGAYNKKGTLYYKDSEQKKYEGEWKSGEYHGEGTLYNEDGTISYTGKWSYGDYSH